VSVDIELSVVIAFLDEEETLPLLRGRLESAGLPESREIVLVSDGSTDGGVAFVERWIREDPRVSLIELTRNFGQQAAIRAGLDAAVGRRVAIMDADLQDTPEDLAAMDEELRRGDWDLVFAVRESRREGLFQRAAYRIYYALYCVLSDAPADRDAGDFCVMSRRAADTLRGFPEKVQYLRGLRSWVGFRAKAHPIARPARATGSPRYTLAKLFNLAIDGIVSFSAKPLRLATLTGAALCALSLLLALALVYDVHVKAPGFTTLAVLLLFLNGTQLLFAGLVGEYIRQIFLEVKGRPIYVVGRALNRPERKSP
jgi:dolichol-phosphate mannosyltransferase